MPTPRGANLPTHPLSGRHPLSLLPLPRGGRGGGGRAVLRDAPRLCRPPGPPPEGSFVIPAERRGRAPRPGCVAPRGSAPRARPAPLSVQPRSRPLPLRCPRPALPPLPGRTFQRRRPAGSPPWAPPPPRRAEPAAGAPSLRHGAGQGGKCAATATSRGPSPAFRDHSWNRGSHPGKLHSGEVRYPRYRRFPEEHRGERGWFVWRRDPPASVAACLCGDAQLPVRLRPGRVRSHTPV